MMGGAAKGRKVTYTNSRDGTHCTYLTNEMTLPAHQLVIRKGNEGTRA